MVGLSGLEPPTSRLSGVRSNQLSYRPILTYSRNKVPSKLNKTGNVLFIRPKVLYSVNVLRKEVIQPHLPIRLPCYDFTPIICPTFGGWLLKGYLTDFGVTNSRGVTGGVYKARERIHRGMLIRDY